MIVFPATLLFVKACASVATEPVLAAFAFWRIDGVLTGNPVLFGENDTTSEPSVSVGDVLAAFTLTLFACVVGSDCVIPGTRGVTG
jgi:hypothetical protein